jgi:hypothetical protein
MSSCADLATKLEQRLFQLFDLLSVPFYRLFLLFQRLNSRHGLDEGRWLAETYLDALLVARSSR